MRFAAIVDIDLPADVIERTPTFWDGCKRKLGADVDLSTDRVRNRVEAATFLYQVRTALDALGVDNARSLVVDEALVFEDDKGRPNDLPELMIAFADHLLVQTQSARNIRLCVEHEEAGLRVELEARMALEHPRIEPAARVSIVGRVLDLAPRRGESAETYKVRIEQLVSDAAHWAALKLQFAAFVSRVEQELGASLPGASLKTTTRQLGLDLAAEIPSWPEPSRGPPSHRSHEPLSSTRDVGISLEERIASASVGPPRYAVRLRRIEDLHTDLVNQLALSERESLDSVPSSVIRGIHELNRLIDEHNRYYPIERNLAADPATGASLVLDPSWRPLPQESIDRLRHATAAMRGARQHP